MPRALRSIRFPSPVIQIAPPSAANAVTTVIIHTSGQWAATTLEAFSRDVFPQAVGSALTYLRRYGLSGILGLATDDDDDGAGAQPRERNGTTSRPVDKPSKPSRPAHGWELAPDGVPVLDWGMGKGETIQEASDECLQWQAEKIKEKLADQEKKRFHAQARAKLALLRNEAKRRARIRKERGE